MSKRGIGVMVALLTLASHGIAADTHYSGSEGIELTYPDTWVRAAADQKPTKIASMRLALLRFEPGASNPNAKPDAVPAAFTCTLLDLKSLPEKDRNGEYFAIQTIAASKKADSKSLIADIKPAQVGGAKAWYFVMNRPGAGNSVREAHTWVVDAVDRHYMFTAAVAPKDAKALAAAQALIDAVTFLPEHRQPDGQTVTFSDKNAKVAFDHPSHWHDEPLRNGMVGQWSVYDAEGKPTETYLAARDRSGKPNAPLDDTINTFVAGLGSDNADVSLDEQKKRTIDGRPAAECVIRFKRKSDSARVTSRVIFVQTPAGTFFLVGTSEFASEDKVAEAFSKIVPNLRLR